MLPVSVEIELQEKYVRSLFMAGGFQSCKRSVKHIFFIDFLVLRAQRQFALYHLEAEPRDMKLAKLGRACRGSASTIQAARN
jgi:hypothetical protein